MNEKQDCVFTYDSKTKKSTISFEIPAGDNGDYSTTLDRWHVWYSLGEVLQEPFKMTIGLYNSANQVGNYIPNITMPQGPLGINFMGSVGGASTTTTPILLSNALVGTDLELVHSGSPIPAIGENVKLVPYHSTMINASTNGALTVEPDAPMLHCTIIRTYQSNFKVKINSVSNITNWTNLPSGTNQNVGEVFRWRMYEAGTSTFDFPLIMKSGEDFSINVNWGDGNEEALTQSDFQTYTNQSGFSTHLGSPFFNDSVGTTFKGETDVLYYMHT